MKQLLLLALMLSSAFNVHASTCEAELAPSSLTAKEKTHICNSLMPLASAQEFNSCLNSHLKIAKHTVSPRNLGVTEVKDTGAIDTICYNTVMRFNEMLRNDDGLRDGTGLYDDGERLDNKTRR